MNNKVNKNFSLSLTSVLACIFVVYIHSNFAWFGFSNSRMWFTSNIIRYICYCAVPLFFMISGATLLDYKDKYSTKTFFKKRLSKVVIPWIVWSIFGLFYCLYTKQINSSDINFVYIINGIFNSKFQDVFWYFPVCISVYLAMPLFASINKDHKKDVLIYLTMLWFILNAFIPFLLKVLNVSISYSIVAIPMTNYMFYCCVGYLISKNDVSKKMRIILYILGIISLLLLIFGTWYLSVKDKAINNLFTGYLGVPCILYSISLFTFIKYTSKYVEKNKFVVKMVSYLSNYTFAIYILHNFVRHFIVYKFKISTLSIFWRLLSPFGIIAICIGITYILRKFKIGKYILP